AKMAADNGGDFLFTCKESSHKALYDFTDRAEVSRHEEKVRTGKTTDTFRYRWIEAVPLRDGKDAMLVNWIGFEIVDAKGRIKYTMAPWPGSPACPYQRIMSPRSPLAGERDGRSRTRAST
ncbi:MAG: hypothetical protein ABSC25_24460, partial [Roseiarcus sp.]